MTGWDEDTPSMTVAICQDYAGLHQALRKRADDLRLSRNDLNDIAGLADGHVHKILAPNYTKLLGPKSLGYLLEALAVKLHIVVDAEQHAKLLRRITPRDERYVVVRNRASPSDQIVIKLSRAKMRKLASLGGKARAAALSPAKRRQAASHAGRHVSSAGARKAALSRWRKANRAAS